MLITNETNPTIFRVNNPFKLRLIGTHQTFVDFF